MNVIEEIKDVLREVLQLNTEIVATNSLKKYGLDSIALVRVIVQLEGKFGIEIMEEDLIPDNFRTLETVTALINKYLSGN